MNSKGNTDFINSQNCHRLALKTLIYDYNVQSRETFRKRKKQTKTL